MAHYVELMVSHRRCYATDDARPNALQRSREKERALKAATMLSPPEGLPQLQSARDRG